MKLKIKCDKCSRSHMVPVDDYEFDKVYIMKCLNCGDKIKYKVSSTRKSKVDDSAIDNILNMFHMKK